MMRTGFFKKQIKLFFIIGLTVSLVTALLCWTWQALSKQSSAAAGRAFDALEEKQFAVAGEGLARQHCATCHTFPEPALLDKNTWVHSALPSMGNYFGILEHRGMHGHKRLSREADLLSRPETRAQIGMMDEPTISSQDWEKILCYFHYHAPKNLMQSVKMPEITATLNNFKVQTVKHPALAGKPPMSVCVKILPEQNRVALSSANSPHVRLLDLIEGRLTLTQSIDVGSPAVSIEPSTDSSLIILTIGEMKPSEKRLGKLLRHAAGSTTTLASDLHRPAAVTLFDANNDEQMDYLICEYGHHTGRLTWLDGQPEGTHRKNTILEKANPIRAITSDVDSDGDMDIYALFAGGREGIWLFINEGRGQFSAKELVTFPAPTGSSSLQLVDIDGDGDQDLLHVSGDNDDTSIILKPYHGLRIFLNDGRQNFTLALHYPMHGAYQAATADFDLDGDLDIALCAYFIDHHEHANKAFILLENDGNLKFTGKTHPATCGMRWLVMDAGDIDGDGDTDIVLGGMIPGGDDWMSPSSETQNRWQNAPEILFLENQTL